MEETIITNEVVEEAVVDTATSLAEASLPVVSTRTKAFLIVAGTVATVGLGYVTYVGTKKLVKLIKTKIAERKAAKAEATSDEEQLEETN